VLDLVIEARRLIDTLPRLKWAEHVLHLVTNLLDRCTEFIGTNLVDVLSSQRFIELGEVKPIAEKATYRETSV
jgi:hypothetical protein